MQKKINQGYSLMRTILIGLLLGPGIMLAASVILAFISMKTANPSGSVLPMAIFAIIIGGFIASMVSAKTYKEKPMQAGLLTGLGNLLIVIVVALISSSYTGSFKNALLPPVFLIGSALLGTIIAARMKTNTKKQLKKLRKQVR